MKLLHLIQGTPRWHEVRQQYLCASEAAAMLGLSKFMAREELLALKKFGTQKEIAYKKHLEAGHAAEERARKFVERRYKVELFPATGVAEFESLKLLSSFDGINIAGDFLWENKKFNDDLNYDIVVNGELNDHYWPQLEHQMLTAGNNMILFTASDGYSEDDDEHVEIVYKSRPERRERVITGWKLFLEDLKKYQPRTIVEINGRPSSLIHTFSINAGWPINATGLDELELRAESILAGINKKPSTDTDFAAADGIVKTLKNSEAALKDMMDGALHAIPGYDDVFGRVSTLVEKLRQARLQQDRAVKNRKEAIKKEMIEGKLKEFAESVKCEDRERLSDVKAELVSACRGKKTRKGALDACDTVVVNAIISERMGKDEPKQEAPKVAVGDDEEAMRALRLLKAKGYSVQEVVMAYEALGS